jgi:hypothetical protein
MTVGHWCTWGGRYPGRQVLQTTRFGVVLTYLRVTDRLSETTLGMGGGECANDADRVQ